MKFVVFACLLAASRVYAQAPPPPPGEESGRIDAEPTGESAARTVGRTVLYIPRGVIEVVLFPVRGAVWANEKYEVVNRTRRLFFNKEGTIGVYPILFFESSEGVLVGAQFVAQLTPAAKFHLSAGAGPSSRRRLAGEQDRLGEIDILVVVAMDQQHR